MAHPMLGESRYDRNSVQPAGLAAKKVCSAPNCRTPAAPGEHFCARCYNALPAWFTTRLHTATAIGDRSGWTRMMRRARAYLAQKPARRAGAER